MIRIARHVTFLTFVLVAIWVTPAKADPAQFCTATVGHMASSWYGRVSWCLGFSWASPDPCSSCGSGWTMAGGIECSQYQSGSDWICSASTSCAAPPQPPGGGGGGGDWCWSDFDCPDSSYCDWDGRCEPYF